MLMAKKLNWSKVGFSGKYACGLIFAKPVESSKRPLELKGIRMQASHENRGKVKFKNLEGVFPYLRTGLLTTLLFLSFQGGIQAAVTPFYFNKTLPVKISLFTAMYNPEQRVVLLHWVTVNEKSKQQYIIERSLDSLHFIVIGRTESLGDADEPQHYYFDDPKPVGGKMYYRIREIDPDGKQFLTNLVSAYKPITQLELAEVRATRQGDELNFAVISPEASTATILVSDIAGQIKKTFLLVMKEGANLKSIYIGDLQPGIYFLQVNDKEGGGSVMTKFTQEPRKEKEDEPPSEK